MKRDGSISAATSCRRRPLRSLALGVAWLFQGADALRAAKNQSHAQQQQEVGKLRLDDEAHAAIQHWCNATLPVQTSRQQALRQLLDKTEQAAEQEGQLEGLKEQVQSLAAAAEEFQSRSASKRSAAARQAANVASELRMATMDINVLTAVQNKLEASGSAHTAAARRGKKGVAGADSIGQQVNHFLFEAEKRAARLRAALESNGSSNGTTAESAESEVCVQCKAKDAAEAKLKEAQHLYFSSKRSMALSVVALQDEAVYLTDVQSICNSDNKVHARLKGLPLRSLREALEEKPLAAQGGARASLPRDNHDHPHASSTVPAMVAHATTSLLAKALARTVATTAPPEVQEQEVPTDSELESSPSSTVPVAQTSQHHSMGNAGKAEEAGEQEAPVPKQTSKKARLQKVAPPAQQATAALQTGAGAVSTMEAELDSPTPSATTAGYQDPTLPKQYAVWTPIEQSAATFTAAASDGASASSGDSWAKAFKQELMDDDDSDSATPAKPAVAQQHHKSHRGRRHVVASATTTNAPLRAAASDASSEDDDLELTLPTTTHRATTAAATVAFDDDDLKPQKAPDLGGGLASFLASKHGQASPAPPKKDADLQIIENLYTPDGRLPQQYTAWTPSLLQLASAGAAGTGAAAASRRGFSGQQRLGLLLLLRHYGDEINSSSLHKLSSNANDVTVQAIEAVRSNLEYEVQGQGQRGEAQQWCSFFEEKSQSALPLQNATKAQQNSSIAMMESEAQLAAVQEELDSRSQLKKSIAADIDELSRLIALQPQPSATPSEVDAASKFSLAVEAIRSEVTDALQAALGRRQAAAALQDKAMAQLQQELQQAQHRTASAKSALSQASALVSSNLKQVEKIRKLCAAADSESKEGHQRAQEEVHALDSILEMLS